MGDLAEFNPKAELPTNFEYVDLESVVGTELINHRTQTKCTAPSRAQRLAQYGDLFYQLVRPYQKNNYLFELNSENFVFSTGYAQLRPSVDGYFLMSLVQNEYFVQKVLDNCTGTSYPAINVNDLAEINIYTSLKKSEQARIGTFFRQLDRLVTLHQCNCNMATRPCEWSSGLRAIAWEQRKLGEVGTTFTGLSGKKASDFGHGKASLITYMNVFSNPIANPNMIENVEVDSRQREVEVGDVFFTTSSETPEEVGMSSVLKKKIGITYLNSFCFGFRPSVKFDLDYLAFMLRSESVRKQIKLLAQGISRFNIAKTKMMYIDIQVPKIDEQIAIGKYFAQLDRLITLHQRKHILLT